MSFSNGEACTVTCGGRTVDGVISLISENQISAMIHFDAMLGKHAGSMPIMAQTSTDAARGIYHSIIDGTKVILGKVQP